MKKIEKKSAMAKEVFDGSFRTLKEGIDTGLKSARETVEEHGELDAHLLLIQKNGKLFVETFGFNNEAQKKKAMKKVRKTVNDFRPEAAFLVTTVNVVLENIHNPQDRQEFEGVSCIACSAYELKATLLTFTRNEDGSIVWGETIDSEGLDLYDSWLKGCSYQREETYLLPPPKTFAEYLSRGLENLVETYNNPSKLINKVPIDEQTVATLIGRVADLITHYEQTGSEEDEAILLLMCVEAEMKRLREVDKSNYCHVLYNGEAFDYSLPRMGGDAPEKFIKLDERHGLDWMYQKEREWLKGSQGMVIWTAAA